MKHVALPIDFETTQPFRRLSVSLGGDDIAVAVYWRLFRDLAYAVREGKQAGKIEAPDVALYVAALKVDSITPLVEASVLMAKDGGTYFCPAFAEINSAQQFAREKRGGHARSYDHRMSNGLKRLAGDVMLMPTDRLVDETGTALTAEQIERVRKLILCCDSALDRAAREGWDFSQALIFNAQRILARYTDEQINHVCRQIAMKKGHAYLVGMQTEQLLAPVSGGTEAIFDQVLDKIGMNAPA